VSRWFRQCGLRAGAQSHKEVWQRKRLERNVDLKAKKDERALLEQARTRARSWLAPRMACS
jgi:hypothetical protein